MRKLKNVVSVGGESNSPRKLKNVVLDTTAVYSMQTRVKNSTAKIDEYIGRRDNNEYMTSAELDDYKSAIGNYSSSMKKLYEIGAASSLSSSDEEMLSALLDDIDSRTELFGNYKNADEYNTAVKNNYYYEKYGGKTYAELSSELSALNRDINLKNGVLDQIQKYNGTTKTKTKQNSIDPEIIAKIASNAGLKMPTKQNSIDPEIIEKMASNLPKQTEEDRDIESLKEEYEWLKKYVASDKDVIESMTLEELEAYRQNNGYKASDNPLLYYDDNDLPVYLNQRIGELKANIEMESLLDTAEARGVTINDSHYFDYYENNRREPEAVEEPERVFDQRVKNEALAGLNVADNEEDDEMRERYGLKKKEEVSDDPASWGWVEDSKSYRNNPSPLLMDEQGDTDPDFASTTMLKDGIEPLKKAYQEELEIREKVESLGYDWDDIKSYLEYLRDKAEYGDNITDLENTAIDYGIFTTLWTIFGSGFQVLDLVGNMQQSKYGLENPYDDSFTIMNEVFAKENNELVKEAFSWGLFEGELAANAYSGLTSGIQSRVTNLGAIAIFGPAAGPAIGLSMLGSQAASSKFHEALMNGNSYGQAFASSAVAFLVEVGFEKIGLDELLKVGKNLNTESVARLIWSALKETGKQGVVEALEESGTNIVNELADRIINGDGSVYERTIEELVYKGMSVEDAKKEASKQYWEGLLSDAVGGFFGGFGPTVAANAVNVATNYNNAKFNRNVTKVIGAMTKANTKAFEDLKSVAALMPDNTEVQKALKSVEKKDSKGNVGTLSSAVYTALSEEFSGAKTIEELDGLKSKFGDGNSYVERAYGEEYERITGERYVPKVTATPTVEIAEGNTTPDLQSNAAPSYESFERSGKTVTYKAKTADGGSVEVYGIDFKTGKLNTSVGAVDVNDVSFGDTAVSQLFKNALSYEAPVADLYIGAYDPERTSVKNYNMAFEGLYGEGSVIGAGKNFEQAYKLYGKIGGMDIHTARVIYDAGENETLIKRQTQQKTNAENKKTATPKGITGEVTESSTGSLTDRERAIYNTIATEFKVDIDVVGMTGDGSLGYANTVTRRIVSSLASGNRISTLLHESGHIMKAWALDTYNEIQDAVVSWYEKHTDKALDKLIEARQRSYAKKGEIISPEEALDEVTNNALEAIQRAKEFDKTFVKSMAEDGYTKTEAKGIIAKLKAFFEKLKNLFRKVNANTGTKTRRTDTTEMITAEGMTISKDMEMVDRLLDLFTKGMNEVRDNYDSYVRGEREGVSDNSAKSQQLTEDEDKLADYDKSITMNDVKLLRTIIASHNGERVSINDFTAEDIEKAQKWAYKFYKELGVKSPFFRAWFGDWRAHSTDLIVETEIDDSLNIASGNAFNEDMKRKFSWDKISGGESIAHSPAKFKSEMKVLAANMPEIVKNAIYFDTQVSDKSSKRKLPGTAFMHCLYSVVNHNGKKYLIKLYGEEAFSEKSSEIFTRAYSLKYIKIIADIDSSVLSKNGGLTESQSATIKSISELFDLVKTYDSEFNPNPVHESMIEKGQPKVFYHGSPAQFTAFDKKKARSMGHYGRGFYFSDSKSHAGTYGNTYSVYLNIVNPLKEGESKVTRDQVKDYLERIAENEDYSIENYGTYDIDTILDRIFEGTNEKDSFAVIQDINATAIGDMVEAAKLFNEVNGTSFDGIIVPTETVAFEPEQIKSATWSKDLSGELDNIGTFSKYDSDIRHQHLTSAEQEQQLAAEMQEQVKALKQINKSLTAKNTAQARMIQTLKGEIKQWQTEGGKRLDYTGIQRAAGKILSETGSKMNKTELTKKLTDLFNYMATNEKPSAVYIKNTMIGIANEIIASTTAVDYEVAEQIRFIKGKLNQGVKFNEQQKGDVKHRFGSIPEYKAIVGSSVKISEKGIPLDDVWGELSDKYPGLFPEDTVDADQPIVIADVLEALGNNRTYNPFYREYMGEIEHAVIDVSRMIVEGYYSVPELISVKAAHRSAYAEAKAEFDKAQKETKEAYKVRLEQAKNNYRGTLNAIAYENSQKYKEYRTERALTDEKNKVKKLMKTLSSTLANPTKTRYAPVEVFEAVIKVCEAVNLGYNLDTNIGQYMAHLARKYYAIRDNNEILEDYKSEFSERIYKDLNAITSNLGNRSIAELSYKEMYQLRTTLEDVTNTLVDARRQIGVDEFVENYDLAMDMIKELEEAPKNSKLAKIIAGAALNPMNVAEMMSGYNPDSVIMKLFNRLRQGERDRKQYYMEAHKLFDKLMSEDEYKDFISTEYDVGLYDAKGHKVLLTKAEMAQIIMSWEREQTSLHLEHLNKGGVKIPDLKLLQKGRTAEALNNSKYVRNITLFDIQNMREKMDTYSKRWMAVSREYFNGMSRKAVNDVSMKLLHRLAATAGNYIPFEVDDDFRVSELKGLSYNKLLENAGLLKSITPGAHQPLVIMGLNICVDRNIDIMAKLKGLAIPLRDVQKVYQTIGMKEDRGISVKDTIRDKGWNGIGTPDKESNLFEQVMTEMQAGRPTGEQSEWYNRLKGNQIKAILSYKISAALKNMTAYTIAGSKLSTKALTAGIVNTPKRYGNMQALFDEIDKYTPLHYMRRVGLSTPELTEMANVKKTKGKSFRGENWIKGMDVLVTASLWEACKSEIGTKINKGEIKHCTIGTDAYFSRVAKLYNEVIEETQQSNDVLFKSEMQRSKSFVLQQATLFKTDMFVNYNILHSGVARLNATRAMVKNANTDAEKAKAEHLYKQARKSFGKAVASQLIGNALLTLLTFLGNGVFRHKLDKYRDEEGELSAEGVLWELFQIYLGTAAETVTAPVSAFFDWAGYLESLVTGDKFYENEDLVSGMVSDLTNGTGKLIDAVISMWDEDTTTADKAKGMIDSFKDTAVIALEAIGVPAGNIEDIANAAWLYGQDLFTDKKLFESGYDISNKERIAKVSELIEKGKHQDTGKYVSDWVSEKALELAEKDGVSEEDLEKHEYFKNKYTDKAKDYIKSLFREKYKDEYLDAVEKKDVKTVKKIKVILYNTRLYAEKDKSGNEINDIDAVFTDWRKSAFKKEYEDKYKDACGTGDEKEMRRIEAAVRASGFYKKPDKTLKNWREAAEGIKDAEE